MANNVTRTITTFEATAFKMELDKQTMTAKVIELGKVQFVATNATKNLARAAFKANGIDVPRGSEITWQAIESTLYAMPVETFIANAQPIKTEKGMVELD